MNAKKAKTAKRVKDAKNAETAKRAKRVFLKTFGCTLNQADGELLALRQTSPRGQLNHAETSVHVLRTKRL